jgi:hypothetical protein
MKCVLEKTRKQNKEEATRGIEYKNKGWKGSQRETGKRGGTRGHQDEKGNQWEAGREAE